ncbi:poly-beta-1,6-N-acetyl-D-glucosamine N-deacetylase PgaB [Cupriavidus sp. IK-TO18]|uniref:poly-beta-1,6-N-acetyl-D-glucosamine N-deacetylase PgaB n=1 Tax=Cupriavidus sp. IK-TO18 TaxID=2782182 RepID=UPI00189A82DC|nr:poly-beta-1,6-N-acetyl-D-glucosamine N-deacetylase PgaB [Cupriavidus sp. IK-TO18]MBF6987844.1 poly-beta-1,6-N-acetyl-D-glucosamine N-deacetylase PgaB [Cupriavidus sp. IK-TO18]
MTRFPQRAWRRLLWLLLAACLLAGCAKDIPVFTPPAQRPLAAAEQPWPNNHLVVLAYHDVEDRDPDQAYLSVRTDHLIGQLAWLRENGYQAVSVDQVLAARRGGKPLPARAVLLTFDDGYRSFHTRVLPILKAYRWPAVLAPVGAWLDTPAGQPVDFGGTPTARDRLLTWQQLREISASGLVEIGAHTDALHYGINANPQGNTEPAAAVRAFDAGTGHYETDATYAARVRTDMQRITKKVHAVTGKPVRVWVWPYGAEGGTALRIIGENGYEMALTLEDGLASVDKLMSGPRMLVTGDPGVPGFAQSVATMEEPSAMRVAHVDLDYVYDPDPAQLDRNLDRLVQRIYDLKINTVFLQAFSDEDGSGLVRSVYFPNRWLPMRADLFNRVAWQLGNRAKVKVYAWMPVLSFDMDPSLPRVTRWDPATNRAGVDAKQYRRLSPFDPVARQRIAEVYEDLARHAFFQGLLFHDDAILSDFEDASAPALAAYRKAGLPDNIAALRADPETMQRWTRMKSRALVDFTQELTQRVRAIRGPAIKTARNIFAMPILQPDSEAWFAQNLDDFLAAYDWTAPMAMPYMEQVPRGQEHQWLDRIVDAVAQRPGALRRTVFELQARDWRKPEGGVAGAVDSKVLAGWMQRLQRRGARSFGYYPDDFLNNQPRLDLIRPALSNAWYPAP